VQADNIIMAYAIRLTYEGNKITAGVWFLASE